MSAELTAGEQFFKARMSADTAASPIVTVPPVVPGQTLDILIPGGFHSEQIRTAPAGRYVLWTYQRSNDVTGEGRIRLYTIGTWLVRVVDVTADFSTLQPAADRLDKILQFSMASVPGYLIRWCVRSGPYSRVERTVDIERRHLGGYYDLTIVPQ